MNQQFEILDTKQLLEFIKPISKRIYWSVIAKDPRFPKPLMGGNGRKALHSRQAVEEYLKILARDGFIQPHGVYTKTVSIHSLASTQNNPPPFCSPFLKE